MYSAWSCGRISDFLAVNGGVVHGRGFESLPLFGGQYGGECMVVGSN
jgi:hypothetical protein